MDVSLVGAATGGILYKKSVLKNFAIFTRKHSYQSLFLIKLQAKRPAILLKRNSNATVFL